MILVRFHLRFIRKLISKLISQKTNIDSSNYSDYKNKLTTKDLHSFAYQYLIKDTKRITIEMFSREVQDYEKTYVMPRVYSVNKMHYKLIELDDLVNLKFDPDSIHN